MCGPELRHRARVVKDFGPVSAVEGNEARLGQVFLNLLLNAAHAIKPGALAANEVRITTRMDEAGRVSVEFTDTGCGIPSEDLPRIFESFFTTKPVGMGTGLGLAISLSIVESIGGSIVVESKVGEGSTFRVVLPASTAVPKPSEPPLGVEPTGRARVLIVDDEPGLRRALRRILKDNNEVVEAGGGEEALARVRSGERFDVIICDLMMPQMTGMELYAEVARMAPTEADRFIFVTGGAFTIEAKHFLDECPNPVIEKPFDPARVLAHVRSRFGGARSK